jgi:hypothetical protein
MKKPKPLFFLIMDTSVPFTYKLMEKKITKIINLSNILLYKNKRKKMILSSMMIKLIF